MQPVSFASYNLGRMLEDNTALNGWFDSLNTQPHLPDLMCFQDIKMGDLCRLNVLPHRATAVMTNHLPNNERAYVGIAALSRHWMNYIECCCTDHVGSVEVRDLQGYDGIANRRIPDEDAPEGQQHVKSDALVRATELRWAIGFNLMDPYGRKLGRFGTTHHLYVHQGMPDNKMRACTVKLGIFGREQGKKYGGFLMMADFNLDKRTGEVEEMLRASGAKFHPLPPHITSTLSPRHRAYQYGPVPDQVIEWPDYNDQYRFQVSGLAVEDHGSDHQMLTGIACWAA